MPLFATALTALVLVSAGPAPRPQDVCAKIPRTEIPQPAELLTAVERFNEDKWAEAEPAFEKLAAGAPGAVTSFATFAKGVAEARRGEGQARFKAALDGAQKLDPRARCHLKIMLESAPWSLALADTLRLNPAKIRKLPEARYLQVVENFRLLGDFFFAMQARPPFLNVKVGFDAFNSIRRDLDGQRLKVTSEISDRLDRQQALLFADAPTSELVGSE